MAVLRMREAQYRGNIWDGPSVSQELWSLLIQKDRLIEMTTGHPPYALVLGVPHHAAPGVDRIAEDWRNPVKGEQGRPADETSGLTGLAVFTALRERGISCKLVIAAHASDHDPNKTPGCPYWKSIFASPVPALLFELHGAASHRRHAIELSAGRNMLTNPLRFGKVLAHFLGDDGVLAVQTMPGSYEARLYTRRQGSDGRLQNPALETLSLVEAEKNNMQGLHLELKSAFRQPDPAFPHSPRPSAAAWQLARALAESVALLGHSDDIEISAADLGLSSTAMLTRPAFAYEASFLSAIGETPLHEMNDNPDLRVWSHKSFVALVHGSEQVIFDGLPAEPPEEYLWLIDQGEFIGRVFFLHWLNDRRLETDGQVDYWIRPSKRQMGYGRLILRLLLERYRQLGEQRVLISCLSTNGPSRKIIEANGGVYEKEIELPDSFGYDRPKLRYWINL